MQRIIQHVENFSFFVFQKLGVCLLITTLHILESCVAVVDDSNDDNVLHIGGIFPIGGKGGWQGGQVCENVFVLASFYAHLHKYSQTREVF